MEPDDLIEWSGQHWHGVFWSEGDPGDPPIALLPSEGEALDFILRRFTAEGGVGSELCVMPTQIVQAHSWNGPPETCPWKTPVR